MNQGRSIFVSRQARTNGKGWARTQAPTALRFSRTTVSTKAVPTVASNTTPIVNGAVIMAPSAHASGCTPATTRLDTGHGDERSQGRQEADSTQTNPHRPTITVHYSSSPQGAYEKSPLASSSAVAHHYVRHGNERGIIRCWHNRTVADQRRRRPPPTNGAAGVYKMTSHHRRRRRRRRRRELYSARNGDASSWRKPIPRVQCKVPRLPRHFARLGKQPAEVTQPEHPLSRRGSTASQSRCSANLSHMKMYVSYESTISAVTVQTW